MFSPLQVPTPSTVTWQGATSSADKPSSMIPLQSSSSPLQLSRAGTGASQEDQPVSALQLRKPKHWPTTFSVVQAFLKPSESASQSQVPLSGRQKRSPIFAGAPGRGS